VRRSYADILRSFLFSGNGSRIGPGRAARLGLKALLARIRPELCPPFLGPILATVVVTERCNLGCSFCRSGLTAESSREFTGSAPRGDRLPALLRDLSRLGVEAVGFTGGEPLLVKGIENAVAFAAGLGLVTHLNTNATLVDAELARGLLASGLGSINVSLDSADGAVHDAQRGKGSHRRAVEGVRLLLDARTRTGAAARIRLVMALGDHNAAETDRLLRLGEDLGVDGCSFIPVHDSLGERPRIEARQAAGAAARLARRTRQPLLDNSRAFLQGMQRFFEGGPMPRRCSAPRTSILAGADGRLYPCVPAASSGRIEGVALNGKSLDAVFKTSALADKLDPELCSACWWNCHRELDIALGIL
jgi:MoaA/NifB/PqqE/SkfB family radical SAM enzyme